MARNVFVSYKYADENVQHLFGHFPTKARHYVDEIEKLLAADDHIFLESMMERICLIGQKMRFGKN